MRCLLNARRLLFIVIFSVRFGIQLHICFDHVLAAVTIVWMNKKNTEEEFDDHSKYYQIYWSIDWRRSLIEPIQLTHIGLNEVINKTGHYKLFNATQAVQRHPHKTQLNDNQFQNQRKKFQCFNRFKTKFIFTSILFHFISCVVTLFIPFYFQIHLSMLSRF